jgi:uncharacterized membrane protein YphA (DoxX/SURF4 family)
VRISFGVIWLTDAVLKWLPGFRPGYLGMITGAGQGQPGWLKPWFAFWTNLQRPHPTFFAYLVAVIETLIAVAVLAEFARKVTYIAAAQPGRSLSGPAPPDPSTTTDTGPGDPGPRGGTS